MTWNPRRLAAALFAVLAAFQVALAVGAPWGAVAWGGQDPGVLPPQLRIASVVSALVWTAVAVAVGTDRLSSGARRRLLTVLIVVMCLSAVLNAVSPSVPERSIWAPYAVLQVVLLYLARRAEARAAG